MVRGKWEERGASTRERCGRAPYMMDFSRPPTILLGGCPYSTYYLGLTSNQRNRVYIYYRREQSQYRRVREGKYTKRGRLRNLKVARWRTSDTIGEHNSYVIHKHKLCKPARAYAFKLKPNSNIAAHPHHTFLPIMLDPPLSRTHVGCHASKHIINTRAVTHSRLNHD